MADEKTTATFALELEDGTSGAAGSAATALQRLRGQIDADTKALAAMQRAMKNLQGGTQVNVAQFRKLKEQIDAKKAAIAQNTASVLALGGSLRGTSSGGRRMSSMLEQLTKNAQGLGGPMGGVVGRFGALRALLAGGALALGVAAIAAAFAALGVAATAATAALFRYGLAQADARRSELLRLEGLTKLRNWYGIAAGKATDLQAAIDRVAGSTALGRDQVARYAEQLYRAHLRGGALADALEAVAIKATTQGDAMANQFASWAAGANMAGQSVKRLANDVKARLGGIAARQMLALDVQAQKMREGFDALFNGLRIEGLLRALNVVTSLFSQSTASGRALKAIVNGLFQPMINAVEFLAPYVKRFFQGMVIGGLILTIALLKVRNWLRNTFGDSEILRGIDGMRLAMYAGVFVVSMLAGALVSLAVVAGLVAAPFVAVGLALWGVYETAYQVVKWFRETKWSTLGKAIVDGIVAGLKGGARWVIDTVKGLGESAWKAFKTKLGIASPSKAFAKLGLAISQGVGTGVQSGAPQVNDSVGRMVDVPREAAAAAPVRASSAGVQVTIHELNVHGEGAREQADDFVRQLERALEVMLLKGGGAPA